MRKTVLGAVLAFGLLICFSPTAEAFHQDAPKPANAVEETDYTLKLSKPVETIELKSIEELIHRDTLISDDLYGNTRWKYDGLVLRGNLPPLYEYHVQRVYYGGGETGKQYRLIFHKSSCSFKIDGECVAVEIVYQDATPEEVEQYWSGKKGVTAKVSGIYIPSGIFPTPELRIYIFPERIPAPSLLK